MASVKTFNPKAVIAVVGGVPLSGFAEGTMITAERASDAFEKYVGTQGEVSRAKLADISGTFTFTLAATSSSNDYLSTLREADELTGSGIIPVSVTDLSGTTVLVGAMGWIKKAPKVEFGKSVSSREWVLDVAEFDVLVGGNNGI
jgi:hypothetical protein